MARKRVVTSQSLLKLVKDRGFGINLGDALHRLQRRSADAFHEAAAHTRVPANAVATPGAQVMAFANPPRAQAGIPNSADLVQGLYGNLLHTNESPVAQQHLQDLALIPLALHKPVLEHMSAATEEGSGIWLGHKDLTQFEHPYWNLDRFLELDPKTDPTRQAYFYDYELRAMFLGHVPHDDTPHPALLLFGRAFDDATNTSFTREFGTVYHDVISHLWATNNEAHQLYSMRHPLDDEPTVGRMNLFGDAMAWYYASGGHGSEFNGSPDAAVILNKYFRELEHSAHISVNH